MARILIADDSPEIRELVTTILVDEGHQVAVADNGKKALEVMQEDPPDVLVLDLMMPVMDGYQTLKEMKGRGVREPVKVLILTAKSSESDWVRGYRLGADAYLTKPFEVDELVDAVDELLTMTKQQLAARRQQELDKAQLLSRLESLFDGS